MSSAERDVADLLRIKASRERAVATAQQARFAALRLRQEANLRLEQAARNSWPTCLNLLKAAVRDYQQKSQELGITVAVEEIHRLRAFLPDIVVSFSRADLSMATRVFFRMARDGKIYCTIGQTLGRKLPRLSREESRIGISENNVKQLFRAIVQTLILAR